MPTPKKIRLKCLTCGKETARPGYKYCSNMCQRGYEYHCYIEKWKSGKEHGLLSIGVVSAYIKKYLRIKFDDKCCLCGWSQVNSVTGKVPLVADHIDGNWRNNIESNLRLLCLNCDSLLPTFAALNRGRGRPGRAVSKRAREAQVLIKSSKKINPY